LLRKSSVKRELGRSPASFTVIETFQQMQSTGSNDMKSETRDESGRPLFEAAQQIGQSIGGVQSRAREIAEQQKRLGAERLGGVAAAAHRAADQIEQQSPQAARYVHRAASRLEEASAALSQQNLDELIGAIRVFLRERPAVVFAGAVGVGLALSLLLGGSSDSSKNR
jgi:ElaB/YqjD/DUF883 family membrane-anchored ribosome-binding protein